VADVLVYAAQARADAARALLTRACAAIGSGVVLDVYGTGALYQRLGPRRSPPMPDVVFWFGPYAARAAAVDGFLQTFQPARSPDGAAHDPDWKWTTLDYSVAGVIGSAAVASWQDLGGVPRLAMADPERSEVGMALLLASLDRARQSEGDVERGWTWWQQRAQAGLVLTEDDDGAAAMAQSGQASHALTLRSDGAPLAGLAPLPHAIGLAAASRNVDGARQVLHWLTSEDAGASLALSAWQGSRNGLLALQQAAPALDVEWGRQQYAAVRQRWASLGLGPSGR
jgi:ABC-type Fe3+ transport system substrate-binding protein